MVEGSGLTETARAWLGVKKFWIGLLIVGVLGAVIGVLSSQARMGMNTDGTAYYGTAKNVMNGNGPRWPYGMREQDLPLTIHFPPLFALVAGYLSKGLGISDPRITVTYLHGILLGATIILTGWMVRRYTNSEWWALAAAAFLMGTADVLDTFANFMSEPLFIFLSMAGLVIIDTGARRRGWAGALAMAFFGGLLIGAACWSRYAGIAWVATTGLGLLLYPGDSWRRRIALATAASVPMLSCWWGLSEYVYMVAQSSTSRILRFQPEQLVYLTSMVTIPAQWVLPIVAAFQTMLFIALGVFVGTMLTAWGLWQRAPHADPGAAAIAPDAAQEKAPPIPVLFLVGAFMYFALMVFSAVCVDPPATPLEPRLLVPWLPVCLVVIAWALHRRMTVSARPDLVRAGLIIMLVVIAFGNWPRYVERLRGAEQYRVGYTSTRWEQSETARYVREHVPQQALIFCNRCDALYYLTDRNSVWVPKTREGDKRRAAFEGDVQRMCEEMGRKGGFLICFNETWAEDYGMASPKEMLAAVKEGRLVPEVVTKDGTIYRYKTASEN